MTQVFIDGWKAPGQDSDTGPYRGEAFMLQGSTWNAYTDIDVDAPYDMNKDFNSASSGEQRMDIRDFAERLDSAKEVAAQAIDHLDYADLSE